MERYVIQAAYKTLQVLLAFTHAPHRFSLAELTELTGMDKNQVFRAVKTLEHAGFLSSEPDGKLVLTSVVNALTASNHRTAAVSLPRAAAGHMYRLFEQTGETVGLYAYDGEQAVCIDLLESVKAIRWASLIGKHLHLHAGAGAKAILAYLDPKAQQAFLGKLHTLPKYTPRTITDPELMRREIERTRERGYAVSDREYDAETRAVSAPIFSASGRVVGSIAVGGPAFRMADEHLQIYGHMAVGTAAEISAEMGFLRLGSRVSSTS
ncbi:HTH-type transcriptional regulator KipR [Calidithermus terrae]|uniref:HTH-type transcriptional regulator KipR n=1 Tax=Calidithermus terrae TaxID=1408545 RepID=A0A399F0R1_9DEIN|nr:IclR family transcriptional regulator [Calidithermus terrae]RIH89395.1 HTH-type transcriptional regulator KipR [Calidithermus terrae]